VVSTDARPTSSTHPDTDLSNSCAIVGATGGADQDHAGHGMTGVSADSLLHVDSTNDAKHMALSANYPHQRGNPAQRRHTIDNDSTGTNLLESVQPGNAQPQHHQNRGTREVSISDLSLLRQIARPGDSRRSARVARAQFHAGLLCYARNVSYTPMTPSITARRTAPQDSFYYSRREFGGHE